MLLKKTLHLINDIKEHLNLIHELKEEIKFLKDRNNDIEIDISNQKKKFDKDMAIIVSALNELYMISFNSVMNGKNSNALYDYENIYNDNIDEDEDEEGH